MKSISIFYTAGLASLPALVAAQSSCGPSPSSGIQPSLASGYRMQVVATGLSKPRGILLDGNGHLLVVEQGSGVVSAHTLSESNGCVSVDSSKNVTPALDLNHGIEISPDGRTLYASSSQTAYSWTYDPSGQSVSNRQEIVTNMTGSDHSTRTLLLSQKEPGMMIISRGSTSNLDFQTASESSGLSQVKAFNLNNRSGTYDYSRDGFRLGWGLRNEVGVGEHPVSGGIYGVENSADQISRDGVDVHENNPAEEMNFLGYINGTNDPRQGSNFGYPWCFSAWNVSELPNNGNLSVGSQFALDRSSDLNNENRTDAYCAAQTQARLVFQSHMAPLDIKFNDTGRQAWITFHGSWDRTDPVGYKMSLVQFTENGEPVEPLTSMTAATDIFANQDNSRCPGNCFRPVGMAIDPQGRIYVSSDASGEIYLITSEAATNTSSTPSASGSGSSTSSSSTAASTSNIASSVKGANGWAGGAALATLLALFFH